MASQLKGQILDIGEKLSGTSRSNGRAWQCRVCEIFVDRKAGNHRIFGTDEELEALSTGYAMFEISPVVGDGGQMEFGITKVTPISQPQAKQTQSA
jgi:hypothetical protein